MPNTAIARVDLAALRHNLEIARGLCPNSRIMAMVKANAYGHGLIPVAYALSGADGLAVARIQEALLLRSAGVKQRILLLGTFLDAAELATCSEQAIDVTVHDDLSLRCVAAQAQRAPLRVWLKLDSGMHRVGLSPEAFIAADRMLSQHSGVVELVHMTHFSAADPNSTATQRQVDCFFRCHEASSRCKVSLANSAAVIARPDVCGDWARPGIMLYGDNPLGYDQHVPLRAVMTLSARIIALRSVNIGEGVGYNERWRSPRLSRIATVGIGYGDGYPRHARNGTPVWINGHLAPLVGQVSMDSITVDVTDCSDICVGDEVVLWGPQLPAQTVAQHADTIAYQLFASLQSRVDYEYEAVGDSNGEARQRNGSGIDRRGSSGYQVAKQLR